MVSIISIPQGEEDQPFYKGVSAAIVDFEKDRILNVHHYGESDFVNGYRRTINQLKEIGVPGSDVTEKIKELSDSIELVLDN